MLLRIAAGLLEPDDGSVTCSLELWLARPEAQNERSYAP